MKLRTVGVCGSVPGPDSPASCYLLTVTAAEIQACVDTGALPADTEIRDWNIVIELGNGAMGPLSKYINADRIDALLISHLHGDHFADMSALYVHLKHHPVYGSAITGVMTGIQVWGPEGIDERARRVTIDLSKDMSVLQANHWKDGTEIQIGPFHVTVRLVYHLVECYAMRIEAPSSLHLGKSATFAFTADTDYCQSVIDIAQNSDLLLAEAAYVDGRDHLPGLHMSGSGAGRVARESASAQLVLTHIPPWNDPQVTLREVVTEYSGPTSLAVPGGEYII